MTGRWAGGGVRIDRAGSVTATGLVAPGARAVARPSYGRQRSEASGPDDGTSGRGASRAIQLRTSRRLRPEAYGQDGLVVLGCQMWSQHPHRRQ